jgi:hypothetical protein
MWPRYPSWSESGLRTQWAGCLLNATSRRVERVIRRVGWSELFGAPAFTVGNELFWGNDRLEEALGWTMRA